MTTSLSSFTGNKKFFGASIMMLTAVLLFSLPASANVSR